MTGYRSDIDGIRAIAVLMVLIFHAYPQEFPAGFAGVDIFFVISGYLISGIIFEELRSHTFSIRRFYERRVRRIFPALIVVLCTTLLLGWFVLLQDEYAQLGLHTMAGAGFVSNLLLWQELGYFDVASEKKLLLHLWSLGVEEQFYFLAPLFFWGCYQIGVTFLGRILLVAAAASLSMYLLLGSEHPQTVFYWPHTRFWELLSGSLLAYCQIHAGQWYSSQTIRRFKVQGLLPWLGGVMLIAFAIRVQASPKAFLSWWSVVPVLATVLWLGSAPTFFHRRLLSQAWLVNIGKISYPLYLWHWVLLSFCHIFEDAKPFFEVRNPALLLSFLLAWLTYRFIETPIRFGRWNRSGVSWLCYSMAVVFLLGMAVWLFNGLPDRSAAQPQRAQQGDLRQTAFPAELAKRFVPCDQSTVFAAVTEGIVTSGCAQHRSSADNAPRYLVLGDSHAEHLMIGLVDVFPEITWIYSTREGLPLLQNSRFADPFEWAMASSIKGVVLSAHWASKLKERDPLAFNKELETTLSRLLESGKQVILFDDVPIFPINAERCAYSDRLFITHLCSAVRSDLEFNPVEFEPLVKQLQIKYENLRYVNPSQFICTQTECSMSHGDWLLYRDRNHLSVPGSQHIAQRAQELHSQLFR